MGQLLKFKKYYYIKEDIWGDLVVKANYKSASVLSFILSFKKKAIPSLKPLLNFFSTKNSLPLPKLFMSRYKKELLEKQKFQYFYRVLKNYQMKCFIRKASFMHGFVEDNFISIMESRLSTVLVRAGFCSNAVRSRQLIGHGGVLLNGRTVNKFNVILGIGDMVQLKMHSSHFQFVGIGYPSPYMEVSFSMGALIFFKFPSLEEVFYPFEILISDLISFYY